MGMSRIAEFEGKKEKGNKKALAKDRDETKGLAWEKKEKKSPKQEKGKNTQRNQ